MANEERIVRYTMAELDAMLARGEDLTDWARLDAMTDEELEAAIDVEEEGIPDPDSGSSYTVWDGEWANLWMDRAIIAWFREDVEGTGIGYKTRVVEVLREYVAAQEAAAHATTEASLRHPQWPPTPRHC